MAQDQATSEDTEQQNDTPPIPEANPLKRLLKAVHRAFLDERSWLAYLPIIAAVILLFCGASWQMLGLHTDAARYQCYALTFWRGSAGTQSLPDVQCSFLYQLGMPHGNVAAFSILPFEYPPLTLSIFSPALLAPLGYYQVAFAVLMALVAIFIYWLLLRYGPRGAGIACALYLVLGAWATAEGRFDLVPATLTLLCLIAAERGRWALAYLALAAGFLLKIYPVLLLPVLFIAEQTTTGRFYKPSNALTLQTFPGELWRTLRGALRWRWTNLLLFFAASLVIGGLFALLNFQGAVLSQLSYFANRPIQIESTGSTLLELITALGQPASIVYTFGSINIESNLGSIVALLFEVLFVLGYLFTLLLQWRGKLDAVQAFLAIILVFIITGKVFSPQYLIWLIPLLAYSGAFNWRWLGIWCSISLLTTAIYPYIYAANPDQRLTPFFPGFVELVAIRNVLLILVTLALLFNWWRLKERKPLVKAAS